MPVLRYVAAGLRLAGLQYQRRYNRLHKSIYGLSYDLHVLNSCYDVISIYCSMNFLFSNLVRRQLSLRFPLFYTDARNIPVSKLQLCISCLDLFCSILVVKQLHQYRKTQNINQGVSYLCLITIASSLIFGVFTFACSTLNLPIDSGRFGVFYLEHVNYMWVIGTLLSSLKLFPQVTLNWSGMCTQGLSSKYVVLTLTSELLEALGMAFFQHQHWFEIPFNFRTRYDLSFNIISLVCILYQAQYLYLGAKRRLPRRKRR
ncbi:LAMI_0A05908g1_1 [Lachancea mirantina]|uniref:LAMI_0A05908g1_1 n=1 Tax=Lachancea mirantina TaxID=1230905 RepID=A0A1G4IQC7_9SACH|nr:LAMI_0A05908g1_1 [Lachancea mirantina]